MSGVFTLQDIDGLADDVEWEGLEFALRYRDGTSFEGHGVATRDEFEDDLDWIVEKEIDLRLAQSRPPRCPDAPRVIRPEPHFEVESNEWGEPEELDEWGERSPFCGCLGACFCDTSPHDLLQRLRYEAIKSLAACTAPAIIATWRWQKRAASGMSTVYCNSGDGGPLGDLGGWLPTAKDEDS